MNNQTAIANELDYEFYVYKPKTYDEIVKAFAGVIKQNDVYMLSMKDRELAKIRLQRELERSDMSRDAFNTYVRSIREEGKELKIDKFAVENITREESENAVNIKSCLKNGKIVIGKKMYTLPPYFKRALLFTCNKKSYIVCQPNMTSECEYARTWCEANGFAFRLVDGWATPGYKAYEITLM